MNFAVFTLLCDVIPGSWKSSVGLCSPDVLPVLVRRDYFMVLIFMNISNETRDELARAARAHARSQIVRSAADDRLRSCT